MLTLAESRKAMYSVSRQIGLWFVYTALMKTHVISHSSINHSLRSRIKTRIIELKLINARNAISICVAQRPALFALIPSNAILYCR